MSNACDDDVGLASGFLRSAERYPTRPAIALAEGVYDYARLLSISLRKASAVEAASPVGDQLVAVFGEKTLTTYSAVLGALISGRGYVPLNPGFPIQRTANMLNRSGARFLFVDAAGTRKLAELMPLVDAHTTVILEDDDDLNAWAERFPDHSFTCCGEQGRQVSRSLSTPDAIAYLLFTSGSTGNPKGVGVTHANVHCFLTAAQARYQIQPSDRMSQMFALTFDLSVFDMFMAWNAGACLCIPSRSDLLKPGRYIVSNELTVWFSVPSTALFMRKLGELKGNAYPNVRLALFCGEALSVAIAAEWQNAAPNATVENLYGPTELTIACTVHRFSGDSEYGKDTVPIGKPLPDMEAIVVDEALHEVSDDTPGELLLTGPQRTPGYWKDTEKTTVAFVRVPEKDSVYYRTGDLVARRSHDGVLEYLGRVDFQVQISGHRVELGEVESRMRECEGVDEAIALGWPETENGFAGLVGFVFGSAPDPAEIRSQLKRTLPDYMVPSKVHVLDTFPLNSNGKIDRTALREMIGGTQR